MEERFETLMKRVVEAYTKTEQLAGFSGYQVEFGEGSYAYTIFAKDAATYYQLPRTAQVLTEAFSEEETEKIFAEWRACIRDYEYSNWTFRPDLSHVAAPQTPE